MTAKSILSLAPRAGALVTCGTDPATGHYCHYRVSAYMRPAKHRATMNDEVAAAQAEAFAFGVIEYSDTDTLMQMEFCPRSEATHLALTGRRALVSPIASCKVIGRVPWAPEQLRTAEYKADSLGQARQVV